MCINEENINCESRLLLTKRQRNLCNDELAINRSLICSALAAFKLNFSQPVKCLEGMGICGINGMLWKKYLGNQIEVTINGCQNDDVKLIEKNVNLNGMNISVINEDPCILLRRNVYDFIFLNCKTNTSYYLDSVFSNISNNAILIISTSEDSSLYWQAPEIAFRNYGGTIAKTSYHREIAIRLVIAEMARACARYCKSLKILSTIGFKSQQAFTIIATVKKDLNGSKETLNSIKKLAHCNICEDHNFLWKSYFLDKLSNEISCQCSKLNEGKVIIGLGPLWSGEIFDVDFISLMIKQSKELSFGNKILPILNLILEEARCFENCKSSVRKNKIIKLNDQIEQNNFVSLPYFYFNTHKHSPKKLKLPKINKIINLLQTEGFHASRTHLDPEAVRTNASLREFKKILEHYPL